MFYSYFSNRPVFSPEKNSGKKCELFDGLAPFTVKQQVERFQKAGEKYEFTRRRELMALHGDVDDPDEASTPLDQAEDLADFADIARSFSAKLKSVESSGADGSAGNNPEAKPDANGGVPSSEGNPVPERKGEA